MVKTGWWMVPVLAMTIAGWGCVEKRVRVSGTFGPMPFHSKVTVTGTDVPGPLRIRDVKTAFSENGAKEAQVPLGGPLGAVFTAWVNGHGQFLGRWERNGQVVDRVDVFLTYGETLEIRLEEPGALALGQPGDYRLRFVVESPAQQVTDEVAESLVLSYQVGAAR
ncbi:MAG: hypothetical protein OEY97_02220 [Nitrospirota bacterium]|nr:hypothetical protein [Nitrospirota bacterium]